MAFRRKRRGNPRRRSRIRRNSRRLKPKRIGYRM